MELYVDAEVVEDVVEDPPIEQDEILDTLEKPKKIKRVGRPKMSEAQKEALRAGREKAKLNQQRRMLKEREERMMAEGMIADGYAKVERSYKQTEAKIQPEGLKEDTVEAENEPYIEPEVEIVKVKKPKAKPKPKPKKKIVYVEESASDDDGEEVVYRKRRPRTRGRHYSPTEEAVHPKPPPPSRPSLIFK